MNTLSRLASACLLVALATPAAAHPGGASPAPPRADRTAEVRVAEMKTFNLLNPMPFPIDIRVLGDAPGFPKVVKAPGPSGAPIPIPYPDITMKVRVRPSGTSKWSPIFTLPWKSGSITLPGF
jgi:hypothetical protein